MKKIGTKEELVDAVLEQIKKDVAEGDVTAIEELLLFLDNKKLISYLPEGKFKFKNTLTDN